jgi:hypothetical protein
LEIFQFILDILSGLPQVCHSDLSQFHEIDIADVPAEGEWSSHWVLTFLKSSAIIRAETVRQRLADQPRHRSGLDFCPAIK